MNLQNRDKERGAILLEAAIAIPILVFVLFQGFELTRLSELQLVKRDLIRVFSMAKMCTTKQSDQGQNCTTNPKDGTVTCVSNVSTPARKCLEGVVNQVKGYTGSRFPDFEVYIQAYAVADDPLTPPNPKTDPPVDERQTRLADHCPDGAAADLSGMLVVKVVDTIKPPKFVSHYGFQDPNRIIGFAVGGDDPLFHDDSNPKIAEQLCRTGSVYIVEYTLGRTPMFSLNLTGFNFGSSADKVKEVKHYEVGIF